MASLARCPRCGRKAKDGWSSNHFPVYMCNACGTKFCEDDSRDHRCPDCGSGNVLRTDTVYA